MFISHENYTYVTEKTHIVTCKKCGSVFRGIFQDEVFERYERHLINDCGSCQCIEFSKAQVIFDQ